MSEEIMLSTDPRRYSYMRRSQGSIDRMRDRYESEIQWCLKRIEGYEQEILLSLLGQTVITDPLIQCSDPEQERKRLLWSIDRANEEIEYLNQCLVAVKNSVPKPKGSRKPSFR